MIKATIRRLTQTLNNDGIYQATLHLVAEDGREMEFSAPNMMPKYDNPASYRAHAEKNIKEDNGWVRLSVLNTFANAVISGIFVPQILAVTGAGSVDDLPGRQVICVRHNELTPAWVWEISNLQGTKSFSADRTSRDLSDIISVVEGCYERRGAANPARTARKNFMKTVA